MRTARRTVLAGLAAAALATGCFGLWRGEYYEGRTGGDVDPCAPFRFDVSIEEGGRIRGAAHSEHPFGVVTWDVLGTVSDGAIVLQTQTPDPRVPQRSLRWRGSRRERSCPLLPASREISDRGQEVKRTCWPVDSRTAVHRSPPGATWLRLLTAAAMGTWTNRRR